MTVTARLTQVCRQILLFAAVVALPLRLAGGDGASVTITGTVTDAKGKPIVGALVRAGFGHSVRATQTGPGGVYKLADCDPRTEKVVVSAPGHALEVDKVPPEPGKMPIDFQMARGRKIRVRVVDERGRPIPGARIAFRRWRYWDADFAFDHLQTVCDQNGVWEWHEAPEDFIQVDLLTPGRMVLQNETLVARGDEYVFQPPPGLVVSGRVVDSQTKRPVETFRIVPGGPIKSLPRWHRADSLAAANGQYRFALQYDSGLTRSIRVEAVGYLPAVSREFKIDEKSVSADFELTKSADIEAHVLTPDGRPAAGAKVAVGIAGASITIAEGSIEEQSTSADMRVANESGYFRLTPQERGFSLIITHDSGYALFQPIALSNRRLIQLDPWARVEGTYRVNGKPMADVALLIQQLWSWQTATNVPTFILKQRTTTRAEGRFFFDRAVAGRGHIGRRSWLTTDQGKVDNFASFVSTFEIRAARTLQVDLGENGLAIIGRLMPPRGFKAASPWQFATVEVELCDADGIPNPRFEMKIGPDGRFRTPALPQGMYRLQFHLEKSGLGHVPSKIAVVWPSNIGRENDSLDLGTFTPETD